MDGQFAFSEEQPSVSTEEAVWRVLAVDHDDDFQRATAFVCRDMDLLGGRVELIQASSLHEAEQFLAHHKDIALVMFDVWTEGDEAALRLIKFLREEINNRHTRIVLLAGESGRTPTPELLRDYDIIDCWSKRELNAERLLTILTAAVRGYAQLRTVAKARRGLQMIIDSSNTLFACKTQVELAGRVIAEISQLLNQSIDALVCMRLDGSAISMPIDALVVGSSGRYARYLHVKMSGLTEPSMVNILQQCFCTQQTQRAAGGVVVFLPRLQAGADYVCFIRSEHDLDDTELELLTVFSASISRCFFNVALFSRLENMAYQDDLLNIPNRNALLRTLDTTLHSPDMARQVLVLIDIDNFSGANTAFGTGYGDFILGLVAKRLRDAFSNDVFVARVRDDVFAILGPHKRVRAQQIVALFRKHKRPYELGQVNSLSSVTMHLSDFSGSARVALQDALLTLKQAKRLGHDQHSVYDPGLQSAHAEAYRLLLALRDAVEAGQISVVLQPQVDLLTHRVTGVEALARWYKADGSMVPPLSFIPLAEATGYILPLGDLLMRLSLRAAKQLADAGYGHVRVAVNVSAPQLQQHDFIERFSAHLQMTGVLPTQVEVEITESVAMRSFDVVCEKLSALRAMGVEVAIDDFGTGFSSLSYLQSLPADRLKIDRSFVMEIGAVSDQQMIAEAVIQIASRVGMRVIAEGVETQHQADWMLQHGCQNAQGYLFAKPMACATLLQWLAGPSFPLEHVSRAVQRLLPACFLQNVQPIQ